MLHRTFSKERFFLFKKQRFTYHPDATLVALAFKANASG
jgi:hypothetical protein